MPRNAPCLKATTSGFRHQRGSDHERGGGRTTARVMQGRWRRCRHELTAGLLGADVSTLASPPSASILGRSGARIDPRYWGWERTGAAICHDPRQGGDMTVLK